MDHRNDEWLETTTVVTQAFLPQSGWAKRIALGETYVPITQWLLPLFFLVTFLSSGSSEHWLGMAPKWVWVCLIIFFLAMHYGIYYWLLTLSTLLIVLIRILFISDAIIGVIESMHSQNFNLLLNLRKGDKLNSLSGSLCSWEFSAHHEEGQKPEK